jgi:hypothetical protein
MEMAMWLDYKPMRYEGKGFLRNLNIRIHRDITGEMGFGVVVRCDERTKPYHSTERTGRT